MTQPASQHSVAWAREGIRNLVNDCAEVQAGEMVVLVNDPALIEKGVGTLIEEAVQARGARSAAIWVEPQAPDAASGQSRGGRFSLAAGEVEMLLKADKVIAHADPDTLARYLADADKQPTVVTNRAGTLEDMASATARYPWGVVRVIYDLMNHELFSVGSIWRITSSGRTDLSGVVAEKTLRSIFFEDEVHANNRGRSFTNAAAYLPVASTEAEGTIDVEWLGGRAELHPAHDPPCLEIKQNKISSIGGGLQERQWVDEYWAATESLVQRFGDKALVVDSWHSGAHPWSSSWAGGTRHLHFHMGRTSGKLGDFVFVGIKDYTLTVDGQAIVKDGRLAILDHPKVKSAAERYDVEDWREAWPRSNRRPVGSA